MAQSPTKRSTTTTRVDTVAFSIRFTAGEAATSSGGGLEDIPGLSQQERLRRRFWEGLWPIELPNYRIPDFDQLDNQIDATFGINLTRRLLGGSPHVVQSVPFFIKVESIKYGSLGLVASLVGAKNAAEFFGNNYDVFEVALSQYSLLALSDSIMLPLGFRTLRASIDPSQELRDAFDDLDYSGDSAVAKFRRAWNLANTSLIIPVLLAIIVLGLGYWSVVNDLSAARHEESDATKQLMSEQTGVLSAESSALTALANA